MAKSFHEGKKEQKVGEEKDEKDEEVMGARYRFGFHMGCSAFRMRREQRKAVGCKRIGVAVRFRTGKRIAFGFRRSVGDRQAARRVRLYRPSGGRRMDVSAR